MLDKDTNFKKMVYTSGLDHKKKVLQVKIDEFLEPKIDY